MAGKSAGVKAGKAYVELGAEDQGLLAKMRAAETRLKAFGSAVKAIGDKVSVAGAPMRSLGKHIGAVGAAITGAMLGASKLMADVGGDIADMSARTGVGVEALSEIGFAAQLSGTDLGTFEGSVAKMQKTLAKAAAGSKGAQEIFSDLGVDFRILKRLSPEDQFKTMANAISRVEDPTLRAAAAMSVFGKSGTAMLPLIKDGAAGIEELQGKARDLGLTLSADDVKASEDWGDTLDILGRTLRSVVLTVGTALMPMLTDFASTVVNVVKTVRAWIDANRPLVVLAFQIGAGIMAAGAAVIALGGVLSGVGAVLGAIGAGISGIGVVIGSLLSPITLIVAGVVGLGAAILKFTGAGSTALGWLGERFAALKDAAAVAFKGIGDALAAGDIALAGQILWQSLKIQFMSGINKLKDMWADWGTALMEVYRGVVFGLGGIWIDALAGIQSNFINALGYLRDGWSGFVGFLQKSWNNFGGFFAKVWARIKALFRGGDAEAEIAAINADVGAKNSAVDQSTGAAVSDRMQARDAQLAAIEADRAGSLAALGQDQQTEIDNRRKEAQDGIAARAAELKAAQDELAALTKEAADKKAKAATVDGLEHSRPGGPTLDPQEIDKGIEKAAKTVSVSGSFSAAAAAGLGAGDSVSDAIKEGNKEAKKTNDKLDKTNRLLEQAGSLE